MNTSYLLGMACSALAAAGTHFLLAGQLKKRGLLCLLTLVFGTALGIVCARLFYCLIEWEYVAAEGFGETLFSDNMEWVSYYGGMAGVIFGAALAALCTGNKPMAALNAYAPAGALMAALARFCEYFLGTICTGKYIEQETWQFFPVAISEDYYGSKEWYLAVFVFAGVFYLAAFLLSLLKLREKRFVRTLFYLCLPQIFCESLRSISLIWTQFVRVEQLACMVCMEVILLLYGLWAGKGTKKRFVPALAGLLCAGVFVALEFALDKTDLPHVLTYSVMILFLGVLAWMECWGFKLSRGHKPE